MKFENYVAGLNAEKIAELIESAKGELVRNLISYEGRIIIETIIGSGAGSKAGQYLAELLEVSEDYHTAKEQEWEQDWIIQVMEILGNDIEEFCGENDIELDNYTLYVNFNENDGAIDLFIGREDYEDFSAMDEEEYAMILALADHFGCDISEIVDNGNGEFQIEGTEYLVLTDDEADEKFEDYQQNLWDEMGLGAFSEWAKDHIIRNYVDEDFLKSALRQDKESYVSDIKYEHGRLEEEMGQAEVETEDDYIEYLIDEVDDVAEYFIDNFGMEWFSEWITKYNAIDVDAVIEYIKEVDGRGSSLNHYDGSEDEIDVDGEIYYIYRQ